MTAPLRLAAAVAIVAVAGFAALNFFGRSAIVGPGVTPTPTLTPTSTTSASPTAAPPSPSPTVPPPSPGPLGEAAGGDLRYKARTDGIDIRLWPKYTSARYRTAISYPQGWTVRPSDHLWTLAKDASWDNTASESFVSPDGRIRVSAWSVAVKPGTKLDSWIAAYCPLNTGPCTGIKDRAVPAYAEAYDRHPGILVSFEDDAQAFFMNGDDRVWIVAIWRPESDPSVAAYGGARRLLEAFALSMCLGCGEPEPTASPSP